MEEKRWKAVRAFVRRLAFRKSSREVFGDGDIAEVYYWSVVHDRPQGWATARLNWPIHLRRGRTLPSQATLSRRVATTRVIQLFARIEAEVFGTEPASRRALVHYIDGKPLTISKISKDRQSGYGWGGGGMCKGYKLHVLLSHHRRIESWRLAPMSTSEKVMARRIVKAVRPQGYLVGDGNYDDRHLHDQCFEQGELQLVAPRFKPGAGLGHRKKSAGRLRSIEILEQSRTGFGRQLLKARNTIERWFAWLVNYGGGLVTLPPWVRSYRRVHRWVSAKLVLTTLKHTPTTTTYVTT
jgi:transposase